MLSVQELVEIRNNPTERDELLRATALSYKFFCETFLSDHFTIPWSPLHLDFFEKVDDIILRGGQRKHVFAAPRDFGKTSLLTNGLACRQIVFGSSRHIVPISKSGTQAEEMTENLKQEFETNERLLAFFGDMKTDHWSKESWTAQMKGDRFGTKVHPRGRGQQIRGKKVGMFRPDFIIADDIEDDESVESEEQRNKYCKWFYKAVCNSVQIYGDTEWIILLVGTLLHADSLLQRLIDNPSWDSTVYEAFDDNHQTLMPTFLSQEKVDSMVDEARAAGNMDELYQEFRNVPIAPESRAFPVKFQYYDDAEERKNRELESAVLVDPAKTPNPRSADTAIVGVGIDADKQRFFVRDCINAKMDPAQTYNEIFKMVDRLGARTVGLEVTGLESYIVHPFKDECHRRGYEWLQIVHLKPQGRKKNERIRQLIPYYRNGLIYHNKSATAVLEGQILSWPRGKLVDLLDCLAYMLELCEICEKYFTPHAGDDSDLTKELHDALKGDWDVYEREMRDFLPAMGLWETDMGGIAGLEGHN